MSANTPIVTEVQVTPVTGYDSMEAALDGAHAPYSAWNLVTIEGSPSHTGIGEIHRRDYAYECFTGCIPLVVEQGVGKYRSTLGCTHRGGKQTVGDDEEDIQTLDISKLEFVVKTEWAVECALLDLFGQYLDIPVCELLVGGKQRDQVKVLSHLFYVSDKNKTDLPYLDESQSHDPWFRMRRQGMINHEQIVEQACYLQDKYDYHSFKFEGGVFSGDYEIDTVRALKKRFPQGRINIGPSGAWSLEEAIHLCRSMGSTLFYIEGPCGPEAGFPSRETMAEFKNVIGLLVAANMITTDRRQFYRVAALRAVDTVLADLHFWGLEGSLRMAALLNSWGLAQGSHSSNHFDITLTIPAHVVAATLGSPMALDTHWIWQDGQNLLKDTPVIKNGYLEVPDRPGSGVILDMDQTVEANKLYNRMSSHDRDDTMAMQYLIPGWTYGSRKPCLVRQEAL